MERLTFGLAITRNRSSAGGAETLVASGPHVPARAARHGGTRGNRTSVTGNAGEDRNRCNSQAGCTKIFLKTALRADPRARPKRRNRPPGLVALDTRRDARRSETLRVCRESRVADGNAPDTGGSAGNGRPCSAPWPDTDAGHATHANAGPPAGRPRCNTAPADASARTASRTPSTNTADAADDAGLEYATLSGHAGAGPREVLTPERSSRGAEPRFRSAALFTRSPRPLHGPTYTAIDPSRLWLPWLRENGSLFDRHRQCPQTWQ